MFVILNLNTALTRDPSHILPPPPIVCVRACVRASVRACVRVCVRVSLMRVIVPPCRFMIIIIIYHATRTTEIVKLPPLLVTLEQPLATIRGRQIQTQTRRYNYTFNIKRILGCYAHLQTGDSRLRLVCELCNRKPAESIGGLGRLCKGRVLVNLQCDLIRL